MTYFRVFVVFLIFASPILATLYFYPTLDRFNKVTYHIPSFAFLALSAIIFYGLRRYLDYDKLSREPWSELYWQDLRKVPRRASILLGIAIVLLFVGVILSPRPL